MSFVIKSDDVSIGVGVVSDFYLRTGSFDVFANVQMGFSNDGQYHQLMQLLSNYTMGLNSYITLGPFYSAQTVNWLAPALSRISLESFIPGSNIPLLKQVDMYPNPLTPTILPFTMEVNNPIDTEISLTYLSAGIFVHGFKIAVVEAVVDIVVPPRSTVTSAIINATVIYFDATRTAPLVIDVISVLTGGIENFPLLFNYTQDGLTAYIHHN